MSDPVLRQRVAFDYPTGSTGGLGGTTVGWSEAPDSYVTRAGFVYQRGSEAVEAARLAGRSIYKVRIRSSAAARQITSEWRMRDLRRGTAFNIREVDNITDPAWIYLVVEDPGA